MHLIKKKEFLDGDIHTNKYYFCGVRVLKKIWSNSFSKTYLFKFKISDKHKYNNIQRYIEIENGLYLSDLIKYVNTSTKKYDSNNIKSATVVIPVYNGTEHLEMLIPSLLKHTPEYVKIIMVDDCSSDKTTVVFLDKLKKNKRFIIKKNKKNMGFVATINYAMSLVKTKYAIWLNTDTVVPEKWLERLLSQFNDHDKIATITPFTNSGVCFSFPNFGTDNTLIMPLEKVNKAFQKIQSDISINTIYSGIGFCMAIDMDCWHDVGELDYKAFGKGYGEENDWCFRAGRKGWKHLLAPDVFVWHRHGGSFLSDEKQQLCKEHHNILKKRYPQEMGNDVPAFFASDPWKVYRAIAGLLCCNKKTILVIDLDLPKNSTSGAKSYRDHMVKQLIADGHDVILVEYAQNSDNKWTVRPAGFDSDICINLKNFSDIKLLLNMLNIDKIVINNLAFLNSVEQTIDVLYEIKKQYNTPMVYKFHDYLSICPSFFLINQNCVSCDCFTTKTHCKNCLLKNPYCTIRRDNINLWRNAWGKLFSIIDEFNFFSEYTFNKVRQVYPIVETKYTIREHTPLFSDNYTKYKRPRIDNEINIAFCGHFCRQKGAHYFAELSKLWEVKNIKVNFYIIGVDNLSVDHKNAKYICQYTRDELGKILTDNNIHAVVYPSINNETFSYLAQELMILNVPFVCFDNGAHAERIRKYKYNLAEITELISVEALHSCLVRLIHKVYNTTERCIN